MSMYLKIRMQYSPLYSTKAAETQQPFLLCTIMCTRFFTYLPPPNTQTAPLHSY